MMNKKNARRALFTSALSLLLCVSMLIGTTYAWFTDEVVSGNNTIAAGNLDIELEYYKNGWNTVKNATDLFSDELWEPGHTQVVYLKLSNLGTLALKYQLGINVASEVPGVNVAGEAFNLSDHIEFGVVENVNGETGAFADRAAARAAVTSSTKLSAGYFVSGEMLAKAEPLYMALVVYMPESVGNEANYRGDAVPTIELGVNLQATQKMKESDSYGDDYDGGAYLAVVNTPEELASALANGESVKLGQDITIPTGSTVVVPEGATAILDLNGKALSTEDVTANYAINNLGTLTLADSQGTGSVTARGIYNGYDADGNNVTTAKLTVLGGTYNARGNGGGAAIFNYGIVDIDGGEFTSVSSYALNNRGTMTVNNATVDGGIYCIGTLEVADSQVNNTRTGSHTIYAYGSDVTVHSGTFNNVNADNATILSSGSTVKIEGGTFNIGTKSYLLDGSGFAISGGTFNGGVRVSGSTISGGTFTNASGSGYLINTTTTSISGGTFDFDPSLYVASGYEAVDNGDGTYTVTLPQETFEDLLKENGTVSLPAGDFDMPGTSGDVTITGTEDTKIDLGKCSADNVTFNGVTVYTTGYYGGLIDNDTIVYNDCVIDGSIYLYGEKVVFNNCTFDLEDTNDYIWVYATKNAEFNNCTFNTMGKALLVFQDGSQVAQTVKVENCTFNASAAAYNWDKTIHISAVSMDGSQGGTYNVILSGNTVDSDFNGLWQDKTSAGNITVTVDGTTVQAP